MELAGKERRKKWSEASKVEAIAIYNCRDAGTMQKASQEIPVPQPRLFPSQAQDANLSLFLLAHSNARSINTEFLPVPRAMQSGQEFARTANPANPCCVALAQSGLLYKNASLLAPCAPPSRTGRTASSATTVPACTAKAPPTFFYTLDFALMQINARTTKLSCTPFSCRAHASCRRTACS